MNIIGTDGTGFDETMVLFGNGTLVPDAKKPLKSYSNDTGREAYSTFARRVKHSRGKIYSKTELTYRLLRSIYVQSVFI
jgi:hypothetical protein